MQFNTKVQFIYSIGVILMSLGALFAGSFSTIFDKLLEKNLALTPGSESMKAFIKSPIAITMEFYLFNVTNPDAVQFDGAKPILNEIGPYTYMKHDVKENIEFLNDYETIQYNQRETYFFNREKSVGSDTDEVTTVNPVLVTLGSKMSSYSSLLQSMGSWLSSSFIPNDDLFITKPIGELLFKGYNDTVMETIGGLSGDPKHSKGTFAFFQGMNDSFIGHFKVNTGLNNIGEHMFFKERNGKSHLDFFDTPACNMINGTDAKQFPPHIKKKDTIQIYIESICRSADLTFKEEYNLNGLKTYVFGPSDDFYSITNPNNYCFCRDKWFCVQGLMDISSCREGAPVILSEPHFRGVNVSLFDRVEGLSPDKKKHETLVFIEPMTGVVVKAMKRLQINFPITNYALPAFEHVNDFVLPIFWAYEGATAPEELTNKLKNIITQPFVYSYAMSGVIMLLGIFIILYGFWKSTKDNTDGKGMYHRQEKY